MNDYKHNTDNKDKKEKQIPPKGSEIKSDDAKQSEKQADSSSKQ